MAKKALKLASRSTQQRVIAVWIDRFPLETHAPCIRRLQEICTLFDVKKLKNLIFQEPKMWARNSTFRQSWHISLVKPGKPGFWVSETQKTPIFHDYGKKSLFS